MSTTSRGLIIAVVVIAALVFGVASWTWMQSTATPAASPTVPAATDSPDATEDLSPTASPASVASSPSIAEATPTVAPTPVAPASTAKPRATGDPRLAYAAFLLRVNDDRTRVDGLNAALTTAANAQDPDAVRRASVDILDFVDVERDWLGAHPPADCYAAAHDSAGAMLAAYGTAADRAIDWSDTGGGIAGLGAIGRALEAGQTATDALTAFGHTLEATTCPG